jgi:ABC-type proline/glycine betaine transport system substrate-binding protein
MEQKINELAANAVAQAWDSWAAEHPNLARFIDRVTVTDRTVESLRNSDEYKKAVQGFHDANNDLDFLNKIIDLAGPILLALLAA